jgi:DNA-binding NtrC family response regulator
VDSSFLKGKVRAGRTRSDREGGYVTWLDREASRLARNAAGIVIEGEPGVGKRHLAALIHSRRTRGNRGVLLELDRQIDGDELKAILFEDRRKREELDPRVPKLVSFSTVFVRDIHEFSIVNQTRLVRFLIQNDSMTKDGSGKALVVLSTHVPLLQLVNQRMVVKSLDPYLWKFDHIAIPPLRERKQDIRPLAESFIQELSGGATGPALDSHTLQLLTKRDWFDNVRELKLVIEEMVRGSRDGKLVFPVAFLDEIDALNSALEGLRVGKHISLEGSLRSVEKNIIRRVLVWSHSDLSKAARLLGLTEKNLRYRLHKYGLVESFGRRKRKTAS